MTQIIIKPDCGNSPKKALIRDFNIAFAKGNSAYILEQVSSDFKWRMYGDFEIEGKEAFQKEIDKMMAYPSPKELILDSIITHGSEASANGLIVMDDHTFAFCDIYQFKSAGSTILVEMKSFVIKI